jgi:uncharacterized membrane protein YphA (DoxX/SURF4 family)/peroxiredoxin
MALVALAARVLLAIVFATAGVAKLADPDGTRRAFGDFGVPNRYVRPVALLLPLAELGIAVAVLITPAARWGAIAAAALLLVFVAGIARAMARGQAPECHCFGQISSSPAGPRTLIRNAVLLVPAVFVAAYGPGENVAWWASDRTAAEITGVAAGAAAIGLLALSLHLGRTNRRLRKELDQANATLHAFPAGLPVGVPAPGFALQRVDGQIVTLDELRAGGRPVALVFISADCGPCLGMMGELSRWQAALSQRVTIALLGTGGRAELAELADKHGMTNVLIQEESEVFRAYHAAATPSVVIVGADGRIVSQTRSTQVLIETLVRQAVRGETPSAQSAWSGNGGRVLDVQPWTGAQG